MRRFLLLAVAVAMTAVSVPSVAQTPAVDAARQTGQAGERFDGYMGYLGTASPVVRSQVGAINIRRRALYTNLAASRRVAPHEVAIAAGCQLLARVQVGQAYMLADGQWRRRMPGQAAPIPQYCR